MLTVCRPILLIGFFITQAEQKSVAELQSLLSRTIEAVSFVLLLNDYRLGELIAK
jgi:nuclear pore complex protein Nup155